MIYDIYIQRYMVNYFLSLILLYTNEYFIFRHDDCLYLNHDKKMNIE
jgi:hypothetical protein